MTIRYCLFLCIFTLVFSLPGVSIEKEELIIWDFKRTDETTKLSLKRVDNLFEKKYPTLKISHTSFFDQEYIPALKSALLGGRGPDIIWLHQGTEFFEYEQYLMPLDDVVKRAGISFTPESLEVCTNKEDELKGLPLTNQGIGWYYNKRVLAEAGLDPENPPVNWQDFLEAREILQNKGITPIACGNNRPLTTDFIKRMLITAFFSDEEIENFYSQARGVTSPRYRIIMEFLLTLRNENYLDDTGLFRPYFNYAPDSFSRGKTAFIPGLISDIAHWKNFCDALGTSEVGYFPNLRHPQMKRPGVQLLQPAGVIVGINRSTRIKSAGEDYLMHLFSEEARTVFTGDLGLLMPGIVPEKNREDYPVLDTILKSTAYSGRDIEQYIPSRNIQDLHYRLDDLLLNTREISLDSYLIHLTKSLKLY